MQYVPPDADTGSFPDFPDLGQVVWPCPGPTCRDGFPYAVGIRYYESKRNMRKAWKPVIKNNGLRGFPKS